MRPCGKIFMFPKIEKAKHPLTITLKTHPSPMNTIRHHLLNASRHGTAALALACIAAVALPNAQAQTTRVWSGPTNGQYNNFSNWTPNGTWTNGDTLRYNGSVGGNLSLNYQGGQNTGVLLDFTAAQTGTVGISLINEATQSRNFRLGNATNTSAITIAAGAGKVTLNGQSETFRMGALFGPASASVGQTININNAGTLEFGAFTTLQRAQTDRNVDLILLGGGQTTILGQVNDFGTFGGIRVDQNSVLTLSGGWVANTRLMIDRGRTDFTSAAAIGGNQTAWNSIRIGNNVSTGIGTLRYTGTGDVQVDRRIQIGNGGAVNQTGSAIIENTSATGKLVFGNSIFNANGADPLSFGNVNTAAARTLTLGGSNTLANEITGQIIDNSATGTIGVIKEGAGRWILSGSNTYTGATQVNGGSLVINGSTSTLSAVNVNTGTLGGSGTVGGVTTIMTGANHSPGNSPDVQTFSSGLTYNTGSIFTWELAANSLGVRGTDFDGVDVTGGTLSIQSGVTSSLVFNAPGSAVDWTNAFWDDDRSWLVFDNANSPTVVGGIFGTINVGIDSNSVTFTSARSSASFSWSQTGNDIYLNYAAIPEPSTWALLPSSLTALLVFRRRRGTC
jgi:autotransporter-associated beta strand protein